MGCCFGSTSMFEVIEGVHLPFDEPLPRRLARVGDVRLFTNVRVIRYLVSSARVKRLVGKAKDSLEVARDFFLQKAGLVRPTERYEFFGNGDCLKMLVLLLKTNPVFASALTFVDGRFEVKAYDPAETKPSLFLRMMRTLNGIGHRVNFTFTSTLEIASFAAFDDYRGAPVSAADPQTCASSALYNLLFYASALHSIIHVFHFLLTSALDVSSARFPALQRWSEVFDDNVAVKYVEVGLLLLGTAPSSQMMGDDTLVLTGKDGFGSSQALRPVLADVLNAWGRCTTAKGFLDVFLHVSPETLARAGALTEFSKHADMVAPFAADVVNALRDVDDTMFDQAEAELKLYLSKCGTYASRLQTLDTWIQLMSLTGALHGTTLSYGRLFAVPEVMRWRNRHDDTWDDADINTVVTGLGTILGVEPRRHIMTGHNPARNHPKLQRVLDEYDARAENLKATYLNEIIAHPDFDQLGFILSDYCPDDFDGKQLTIATYI